MELAEANWPPSQSGVRVGGGSNHHQAELVLYLWFELQRCSMQIDGLAVHQSMTEPEPATAFTTFLQPPSPSLWHSLCPASPTPPPLPDLMHRGAFRSMRAGISKRLGSQKMNSLESF